MKASRKTVTYAIEIVAAALAIENTRRGMVEKARRQVGDAQHGRDLMQAHDQYSISKLQGTGPLHQALKLILK